LSEGHSSATTSSDLFDIAPVADATTASDLDAQVQYLHELLLRAGTEATHDDAPPPSNQATSANAPPLGSLIEAELRSLIPVGVAERFERGFVSAWDDTVAAMVRRYGNAWLSVFDDYNASGRIPHHLAAATVEALGLLDDGPTHGARLQLFKSNLRARLPELRDAAGQALFSLGDPAGADSLTRAAVSEPISLLRQYFLKVARDLKDRAPEMS